ncbi:TIGR00159 family protein [bacterium]|nr:TIGR00159 family protein [bacterium]
MFDFRLIDVVDIALVALLMYQFYRLLKGTVAINILLGIGGLYVVWKGVEFLQMRLLGALLGQFIGVGVIALFIVFQQEIRKFLLYVGSSQIGLRSNLAELLRVGKRKVSQPLDLEPFLEAVARLSQEQTGALIAFERKNPLGAWIGSGESLEAKPSAALIQSIFHKESPLHDGAAMVGRGRILAARCVLPVSESEHLGIQYGLRHRAALGLSERSDAVALVVSEQTGAVALAHEGILRHDVGPDDLRRRLREWLEETV